MPTASLNSETLLMLSRGNTSDVAPVAGVLGRTLSRLEAALSGEPSFRSDRLLARMLPVRGILVAAVAAVWIGSGIASFALAPDRAEALLFRITSNPGTAMLFTWAGATLDVFLGSVVLVRRWRRQVLQAQLAVMFAYTLIATVALPALWTDPFGSLLKNVTVLAATLALLAVED